MWAITSPAVAEGDRLLVVTEDVVKISPGVEVDSAKIRNDNYLDCPRCGTVRGLYATCPGLESVWETRCIHCDYLEPSITTLLRTCDLLKSIEFRSR